MNCIIPYIKEIPFNSKIREITSISLEHEMNINAGEILGNFIVSGEYKAQELSVNKESFEYVLPFSIDLTERIIEDTIKFNITDFTYEILNDNTLKVIIEFSVIGEEKEEDELNDEREELFQVPEEVIEEDIINLTEEREEIIDDVIEEEEECLEEAEIEFIDEVEENEDVLQIKEENIEKEEIMEDEEREVVNVEMVNDTISKATDTYKTYHIHIIKDNETIDSICQMYKSSKETIMEYNDLNDIVPGDKLIIPEDD